VKKGENLPLQSHRLLEVTPFEEMKSVALHLYEEHRDAIEAAFLRARDA
jgi:hypothetical protein